MQNPTIGIPGANARLKLPGSYLVNISSSSRGGAVLSIFSEFTSNNPVVLVEGGTSGVCIFNYFANYRATIASSVTNSIEITADLGSSSSGPIDSDSSAVDNCSSGAALQVSGQTGVLDLGANSFRLRHEVERNGGAGRTVCLQSGAFTWTAIIAADNVSRFNDSIPATWGPMNVEIIPL